MQRTQTVNRQKRTQIKLKEQIMEGTIPEEQIRIGPELGKNRSTTEQIRLFVFASFTGAFHPLTGTRRWAVLASACMGEPTHTGDRKQSNRIKKHHKLGQGNITTDITVPKVIG